MFCQKCGKEVLDDAVICPFCGCAIKKDSINKTVNTEGDNLNIALLILSIIIPIVGIILWPLKHKETPNSARIYGIAGIVAWVCYFLFIL